MGEGTENRQERNIMILFLSNFLFDDLNRDKFSEDKKKLPPKNVRKMAANYRITRQKNDREEVITPACIQTNEAPIKDVLFNLDGRPLDAVFCFVSEKVGGRGAFEDKALEVWDSADAKDPRKYNNHIELFWERLQSINDDMKDVLKTPLTKDRFHLVDFNESAPDQTAECIRATLDLENQIKVFMENEENADGKKLSMENCNLYADITGGMRTANMAMSAATQLLQYDGAHLKRVVYSDFAKGRENVSDIQPINDLYKLVAGVYAFTKYGRSEALKEYFGDEKYQPLNNLREAMDEFSEAVQLCRAGTFLEKLQKLMESIKKFSSSASEETKKSPKVELFTQMVPNFKSVYSKLLIEDDKGNYVQNRIEIIRWCVKNKLLSQAITFCTEWLPEYFVEHGVIFTEDDVIQAYCNEEMTKYRIGQKNLLMEFCTSNQEWENIVDAVVKSNVKDLIDGKIKASKLKMEIPEEYSEFVNNVCQFLATFPDDLAKKQSGESIKNARLEKMIDKIEHAVNTKRRKKLEAIVKEDIIVRLYNWIYEPTFGFRFPELKRYEDYTPVKKIKERGNSSQKNKIKIINTQNITREMLRCGMLKTEFRDMEQAVDFVKQYTYIRLELRNKVCHASEEEEPEEQQKEKPLTIQDVIDKLDSFLQEIEMLETFKDPNKPKYTGKWKPKRPKEKKKEATP